MGLTPGDRAALLERFECVGRASFDPSVLLDPELAVLGASAAAEALLGAPAGSLPGLPFAALCAPGAAEAAGRRLLALGPEGRIRFETELRVAGGRAAPVEVSAVALGAGGARGLLLGLRDLAEQRRAEGWFRLAVEESPIAISLTRADDAVVVAVNRAFERNLGRPRAELVGRSVHELGIWASSEARQAAVELLRRGGKVDGFDAVGRRADGQPRTTTYSASLVELDGVQHLLSVSRDATQERALEVKLQEKEALLERILETMEEGVRVIDREGRVVFANSHYFELMGVPHRDRLGHHYLDVVPPENVALALQMREEVVAGRGVRREFSHRMPNGAVRQLWTSMSPLRDGDGRVVGSVGVFQDVTERRRLEEQLRQAQKLESVGRLAGGVAHDFNNILTVILGCADALREDLAGPAPELVPDAEQILAAGWRGRDLTRHLLAFARKQVVAPVRLDLNGAIGSSEKLLRRMLGEDVHLVVSLQQDPWPIVCDPSQLEQVLMNLVVNARDAMPGGGTLTLATRNVASADGDRVLLSVRDTGAGMTAEVQAHLFEPFFTTKEPGKGTGLGLATVYGIVSQCGGSVQVESAPGRGTAVELGFPRAQGEGAPGRAEPAPRAGAATGTERLLVVEDDPHVRAVTVRALDGAGYRLLVAGSGPEALALSRGAAGGLDLVVTDVVMPGMSGRELVDLLRRERPGLRALYVSGYPQDAIARHGVLDGGVELLPKPFTADGLLARVRAVLDAP